MGIRLSGRSEGFRPSEIRLMTLECVAAGGVNLAQGICDTPPPPELLEAAAAAMREGFNIYTRFDGLDSLRAAIAKDLARKGIDADPEEEIVVSVGTTGAFYASALATLDPGDEVVLFEPYYGYHVQALQVAGAVPRVVPMAPPDWTFTREDLEAALGPRTRGVMICTPANPSGKVWTRAEIEVVAEVAAARDLTVYTDEIYEHFLYDGREHVPPATVADLAPRTISIAGFSKTYSITGWRIGYVHAPAEVARKIACFSDAAYVCAPAPLQEAVARTLASLPPSYYDGIREEYAAKRDAICGALADAGLPPYVPQGAYYVLADISGVPGDTAKARVMHLLGETGVAGVPGSSFFADPRRGDDLIRFCFAKTAADLDRAVAALRAR